jgi:MFS family permease
MTSPPAARLPWYRLAGLTLFAMAFGVAANSLEPAVLGQRVLQLAAERKNTVLGLTTAGGLLVATLVQPLMGGLSDRTAGRLGRRIPYLIVGSVLASAALFGVVLAPTLLLVVLGVLAFQFGANTALGPWQAFVPDQVPMSQRGVAAGLKSLFEVLGFVLGRTLSGYLVAEGQALVAVAVAAGIYALALSLTWLTARRDLGPAGALSAAAVPGPARSTPGPSASAVPRPARLTPVPAAPRTRPARNPSTSPGLRTAFATNPAFTWVFVQRALFWCGLIALNTFLLYYLIDVVGMEFARASRFVGQISLALGVGVLMLSVPAGRLADRVGRRPLVLAAGLLAAAGTGMILVARSEALLILAGVVLGVAVGAWQSANWALITDIVPSAHAARYLGLANIATAGGSLLGRSSGALLVDPLNRLAGSQSLGYLALYGLTLVMFLLSAWAVRRIPSPPSTDTIGV